MNSMDIVACVVVVSLSLFMSLLVITSHIQTMEKIRRGIVENDDE